MEKNDTVCDEKCITAKISDLSLLEQNLICLKKDCVELEDFATRVRLIFSDSKPEEAINTDERPRGENRFAEMILQVEEMKNLINKTRIEFVNIKELIE